MFEVAEGETGISIPGELYDMPDEVWARVEAGEPPGLYRGPVELEDGRTVPGILFPREMAERPPRDHRVRRLARVLDRPRGGRGGLAGPFRGVPARRQDGDERP